MKIIWRDGAEGRVKVPAAVVGRELMKIERSEGAVLPAVVVDRARPKGSPLHPCFEWDDRRAAERYRLEQAQLLIYALRIEEVPGQQSMPMFLNLAFGEGALSVEGIRLRPEVIPDILEQARRDLLAWKRKYEVVRAALLPVFQVIEETTKKRKKRRAS